MCVDQKLETLSLNHSTVELTAGVFVKKKKKMITHHFSFLELELEL